MVKQSCNLCCTAEIWFEYFTAFTLLHVRSPPVCYFPTVLPEGSQRSAGRSAVKPAAVMGHVRPGEARFMHGSNRVQSVPFRALFLPFPRFGSSTLWPAGVVPFVRIFCRGPQHLRQHPPELLGGSCIWRWARRALAGVALHLRRDHVWGAYH